VPDRPRRQRPLAAGPALAREIAIKVGELRWPELGELDVRDRAAALPDLAVAADGRPAATACLDVGDVALEAASSVMFAGATSTPRSRAVSASRSAFSAFFLVGYVPSVRRPRASRSRSAA
jgi:hypothetical protein